MKNKRNPFARLLSIVMLLSLCCLFSACPSDSKEKDEDPGFNASFNIQELINHKWKCTDVSSGQAKNNNDQIWLDIDTYYLYFKSDKTGVLSMILKDYDTVLGNTTQQEYILFNYTVSGNVITVTMENGSKSTYTYMGEYLQDSSGTIYTPVTMSEGDYEYLNGVGPKTGGCGSDLTYSYDERSNELVISGSGRMNDYTTTNQPWHDYRIEKLTINDGCTYIGAHAFHGLKYDLFVSSVPLPNSVKEIGNQAFSGTAICELSLPTSIEKIGYGAFSGCEYLIYANFSGCDNLEEIDDYAFQSCPIDLGYFTLPKNVRKVGDWAFSTATITKLTLNDGLETVGLNAFSELKQSQLIIPNSVKSIGHLAFHGSFNEIRVGTGLSTLGGIPFLGAYSGKLYVNQSKPLTLSNDFIINKDGNNAATSWTLYVPKGCKSAYQKATGWKSFKSIVEDSSLEGGSSGSEENDNQGDNGDNGNNDNNSGNGDNQGGGSQSGVTIPIFVPSDLQAVDLGLPSGTKWANMNLGATTQSEYGLFFAWGETVGYSSSDTDDGRLFNWASYKWMTKGKSSWEWINKYQTADNQTEGCWYDTNYKFIGDGRTELTAADDAAHANWGGDWYMPTNADFEELLKNTTSEWTTLKRVRGCKFTSKKNGNAIFLPAAGYRDSSSLFGQGAYGFYLSSSLRTAYTYRACCLGFISGSASADNGLSRYYGLSVRPVLRK